ncbi:MAG: hypothetical protein IJI57_09345 [Flexilinea sp.]|nr:hypothetical protein [Flexilinea sp.]
MSHKRILFFFILAGVILAAILGFYFYRTNLGPDRETVEKTLQEFTDAIAAGDLQKARSLLTPETASYLRDPGTELGEKVYASLKLKTVENIYEQGNNLYTADVTLTALDTLKVMAKAGQLFGEQIAENGPTDDADQAMSDIYSQILFREDLPLIDTFCVVRLEMRNGQLFIIGDTALQRVLEGDPETYSEMLEKMREEN